LILASYSDSQSRVLVCFLSSFCWLLWNSHLPLVYCFRFDSNVVLAQPMVSSFLLLVSRISLIVVDSLFALVFSSFFFVVFLYLRLHFCFQLFTCFPTFVTRLPVVVGDDLFLLSTFLLHAVVPAYRSSFNCCRSGHVWAFVLDSCRVALPQQAACGTDFESSGFILGLKALRLCRLLCGQPTLMVAATIDLPT